MYNKIVKWWKDKNINTADDLVNHLSNFQVVFACSSSNIEGNIVTYNNVRDIFTSGCVKNYTGPVTDLLEIVNQKRAFEFLKDSFEKREPLSIDFILHLHKILLRDLFSEELISKGEKPGTFKIGDYCVGTTEVGCEPEYVLEDLQDLLDEINSDTSSNYLLKAAYFHAVFESIHPFADGNGRVGRCLTNYYLLLNNHPPIALDIQDKETYYLALEVYNRTENLNGFKKFMEEQLIETWKHQVIVSSKTLSDCVIDDAVTWLRGVVPTTFVNLPDADLLDMFGDMYTKYYK